MGHIYIFTSPSGKSYIGQTSRPIQKRFKEHQLESSGCVAIYNAIKKYGWENFEKDYYECPDEDLNKHEELMVEVLGTLSPDGYNLREGGGSNGKMSEETKQKMSEVRLGHIVSEETRQKISESKLGEKNYNFGKTPSDETRQKMSDVNKGDKNAMWGEHHSEETRQKISDSMKGEKNQKSKKLYQYDLDENFINSFESCGEAKRHLKKTSGTNIRKCARGEQKTAYGFKWSYSLM